MKFITENKLFHTNRLNVSYNGLLFFFVVYFVLSQLRFPQIGLIAIILTILIYFFTKRKLTENPYLWLLLTGIVLIDIIDEWTRPANHHYILLYLSLSFFLGSFGNKSRYDILTWNCRMIAGLLLIIAGFQKLISSEYMSGSFLHYLFVTGDLAFHSVFRSIESTEVVKSNLLAIEKLNYTNPNLNQQVQLQQFNYAPPVFFKWLAIFSVTMEIVTGLAIMILPKKHISHVLFTTVIIMVFAIRPECGFLCLLSLAGCIITTDRMHIWRIIYLSLFTIFISLIIIRFGYY